MKFGGQGLAVVDHTYTKIARVHFTYPHNEREREREIAAPKRNRYRSQIAAQQYY